MAILTASIETFNVLGEFISSYGFPMVMCLLMFKYLNDEKNAHKAETDALTKALNNNTAMLEVIKDKLNAN